MHVTLSEKTGGKALPPLAWKYLRTLITPHPLGGCNMAASAAATQTSGRRRFAYSTRRR